MDLLFTRFLGTPIWMWLTFISVVLALLVLDLGLLNQGDHEIGVAQSLRLSALDNIFVIALIFSFFAIPRAYQHRVLFWGILGVIVLRGITIGVGATLVAQYNWILYIFAIFLILTGVKMLFAGGEKQQDIASNPVLKFFKKCMRVTEDLYGNAFFVKQPDPQTRKLATFATPLFLALILILIEITDLIFAMDSRLRCSPSPPTRSSSVPRTSLPSLACGRCTLPLPRSCTALPN